jgi:hypothetical protein
MILSAIAAKLKRRSKDDFKGRHYEAALVLQAVSWGALRRRPYSGRAKTVSWPPAAVYCDRAA